MNATQDNMTTIVADLLIVGGGFGGLIAAISAKEEDPSLNVLIVEKQTAGWAGKAPKVGGAYAFLGPDDDAERFIQWHVSKTGDYLNDQDLLRNFVNDSFASTQKLAEWGAPILKDEHGNVSVNKNSFAPGWSVTGIDIDMQISLRQRALQLGVKIQNKTQIVELMQTDGRISGAVGFDTLSGASYLFRARAIILANGDCNLKVKRFWQAATGDGIAAAFRIGAEMRNADFGNLYAHIVYKDTDACRLFFGFPILNANGENIREKYTPQEGKVGVFSSLPILLGIEKEVLEGRGPCRLDSAPPKIKHDLRTLDRIRMSLPKFSELTRRLVEKELSAWDAEAAELKECSVPYHGEISCLKVGHDMQSTIPGLFGLGDTCMAGSALAGAVPAPPGITPGCGLSFAAVSAIWAAKASVHFANDVKLADIDLDLAHQHQKEIFEPLGRKGSHTVPEMLAVLQEITKFKYLLRKSEDRLEEALHIVDSVEAALPDIGVNDYHYLVKYHELRNMILCSRFTILSSMERRESRGMHYREDYPLRDDEHFLKWIVCRKDGDGIAVDADRVPIERYQYRP